MSLGDRDPQYQAKPVRKLLYEGIWNKVISCYVEDRSKWAGWKLRIRQLHRAVLATLEQKGQAQSRTDSSYALDVEERVMEAPRTALCSHWNH